MFTRFEADIEIFTSLRIQCFRCDNGTREYDNRQFRGILTKGGTTFEPSALYTQYQNSVSERRIRLIIEMVTCILHEAKLEKKFWAKAASSAVYIINQLPIQTPIRYILDSADLELN